MPPLATASLTAWSCPRLQSDMDDLVTAVESAGNADRVAIGNDLLAELRDTGCLEGGEAGRLLSVCIGLDMNLDPTSVAVSGVVYY